MRFLQENPLSMNKMSLLSKISASLPYGRPTLPTRIPAANPLEKEKMTISQAQGLVEQLMKRSGVPQKYRAQLAPYITKHLLIGRGLPADQQNTDAVLMNSLSSHTCVKTWVRKAFELYEQKVKDMTDEERKSGGEKRLLEGTFEGVGVMLGQGFNFVQEPNRRKRPFFQRNSEGRIVGILNMDRGENQRFAECDTSLRAGEELLPVIKKLDPTPALPVPTAGKRRTRKKHSSNKKTSRRKRHTNVHRF
jgi:hypothetical protein